VTTSGADAIHYLLIGHLAKDLLPGGSRLGGTIAYAALTAHSLGYTPGLVTAHADDLDLGPLADFPRVQIPSTSSTTFENIYTTQGRTQFVRAQAAPLTAFHLPDGWRRARIVHLAPLAREVDWHLASTFAGAFVGLTPQGWMRTWDAEGRVSRTDWPEALNVLPHVSAAVVSLEDVGGDWAVAERWAQATKVLVVTQGPRGCTVFARGEAPRTFPAPKQPEVDPTGAGDVFATAFFINFYETEDPWASAKFANQVAALSVTRPGLEGVPDPEEIGACRVKAARA
jgi:sugar/nucleoside kinase (ribokinase family)